MIVGASLIRVLLFLLSREVRDGRVKAAMLAPRLTHENERKRKEKKRKGREGGRENEKEARRVLSRAFLAFLFPLTLESD